MPYAIFKRRPARDSRKFIRHQGPNSPSLFTNRPRARVRSFAGRVENQTRVRRSRCRECRLANATSARTTCKTPCQKSRSIPRQLGTFIGQIQSNKTKDIASHFDVVHGLASEKVARRLNDARPIGRPPLKVFIQVNLVNESAKNGVAPSALPCLVTAVKDCQNLQTHWPYGNAASNL